EMEEVRERPRHRYGVVERHLRETVGERAEILVAPGSPALRQRTDTLHLVEDLPPRMLLQRLPQQLAEQPDVVSQRLVGVRSCVLHGCPVLVTIAGLRSRHLHA